MATEAEKQKLRDARSRLNAAGADWSIAADGERLSLFAASPNDGVVEPVATLDPKIPFECQEFLLHAASDMRLVLDLFDRCQAYCAANVPKPSQAPKKSDYAAELIMKCGRDQDFRRFLMETCDLVDLSDIERIKNHMRFVLRVTSLGELNTDPAATARWKKLRDDFKAWRRSHAS